MGSFATARIGFDRRRCAAPTTHHSVFKEVARRFQPPRALSAPAPFGSNNLTGELGNLQGLCWEFVCNYLEVAVLQGSMVRWHDARTRLLFATEFPIRSITS